MCCRLCISVFLFFGYFSSVLSFSNVSIIVVGAGPSGIAAATRLVEHNFSHVVILEAENRTGQYTNPNLNNCLKDNFGFQGVESIV